MNLNEVRKMVRKVRSQRVLFPMRTWWALHEQLIAAESPVGAISSTSVNGKQLILCETLWAWKRMLATFFVVVCFYGNSRWVSTMEEELH